MLSSVPFAGTITVQAAGCFIIATSVHNLLQDAFVHLGCLAADPKHARVCRVQMHLACLVNLHTRAPDSQSNARRIGERKHAAGGGVSSEALGERPA